MKIKAIISFLLLMLSSCRQDENVTLTGRILDEKTGEGIEHVVLFTTRDSSVFTESGKGGYFSLAGIHKKDTLTFLHALYFTRSASWSGTPDANSIVLIDYYLTPHPDTAYTTTGPIKASEFLDHIGVHRKKLSPNEARSLVRKKLPDVKITGMQLVRVGESEEWLFDLQFGHTSASLYLNAQTGEIRSIESDDPVLDKKLQRLLFELRE